ncbi:mersacidin family lantibiotic [Bacillus tropicus]|jgi:mersacidin/lichenicidin family type 2 lantibiotic|uniref:Mersacidin/lichenicidin family type 2 lantibiotic n=1 Tax=Bacillus tropicus TaxID=2026188 RepID=A0A5C4ZX64_9BACI|nr:MULTISPECIES: mersacidin family lantibiotic [Bacillus cereus group]OOL09746.1 lichenicidin prepeptide [Bacillus cereus]MCB4848650.1 mersacidin family lantibiotic [Bacillus tropicus]MCW9134359.1 mersacidin family lantibiotic [Bacillus paramycoides]PJZ19981.1 type 2 lantibiotic [Bacillus cereus]TKI41578.1 mersacidin/lichenicidin family type 2 lantibiotic [Bacillus mycoides]
MSKQDQKAQELLIEAWKDPEIREKAKNFPQHPSGKAIHELTVEELAEIQGASDVQPETTPACVTALTTGIIFSIKWC